MYSASDYVTLETDDDDSSLDQSEEEEEMFVGEKLYSPTLVIRPVRDRRLSE